MYFNRFFPVHLMLSLRFIPVLLLLFSLSWPASAQTPAAPDKPAFTGAVAKKARYRAV